MSAPQTASPDWIYKLDPYTPGKPPEEVERELGITGVIKLASNENPYGPSPAAIAAMEAAARRVHLYPDAAGYALRQAISAAFSVPAEEVLLGNGSAEIIKQLVVAFCSADDHAVISEFAFIAYKVSLDTFGVPTTVVPSLNFGHDLSAMAAACTDKTRLLFVANPNNPTGTHLSHEALEAFLRAVPEHVLVVLDEAYIEYRADGSAPTGLELRALRTNLVVTRTFSKAYALAGLRIGFAFAPAYVAERFNRSRDAFNTNMVAQEAALASLADTGHLSTSTAKTRAVLADFSDKLTTLGIGFVPSHGNFLLIDAPMGGKALFDALLREGVITRPLGPYNMPKHLRISIGTAEEMERCASALARVWKPA